MYQEGFRLPGPYFIAFCLKRPHGDEAAAGPARVGFTVPRAVGKSVLRNRIRRRMREAFRRHLPAAEAGWEIVVNPRHSVLTAAFDELEREAKRVIDRCRS